MIRKLLAVLRNPWFLAGLGLAALAVLIWYIGPLVSIAGRTPLASTTSRLLTIGVLGSFFALSRIQAYVTALRRNRQMVGELLSAAKQDKKPDKDDVAAARDAELATLKKNLEAALEVLKKARLKNQRDRYGRQYLYQLPWYMIIGPPGCGKTTALINSGLNFPLAKDFGKSKIKGVGGTRNCDWWFTNEAVLLDTAGRYTTQDSHQEVDQAAWRGFLELLKKYRRRRPINGAFVAVSLADLIQQSEPERALQAQAVKERIQELHESLGIRFPVYVLFTKADLIAGFMEFFDDLGREERAQVWGMTFPLDSADDQGVVARFGPEFDALEQRLNARLVERLQDERDLQRRDLIYAFPQQFSTLKPLAQGFLDQIFRPDQFAERPLLRGVYFTSGTQEGTPIDRLMSTLAATFGLQRQAPVGFSGQGRGYFITRLFLDVIFPEAQLAGTNLRYERWRAWLQRGAYAGALLLTLLVASAWAVSYARNQVYIQEVDKQSREVAKQAKALAASQHELPATLALLNAARTLPGGYQDHTQGRPWLTGFGLDQREKLGTEAVNAYQRLLNRAFLPRIILRLEQQLRQENANSAALYETLKVYLMLDESQHFEPAAIKAWLQQDWERTLPRSAIQEQGAQLAAHLDALLEQGPVTPPIPLDRDLIERARSRISRASLGERIYERVKEADRPGGLDFRLSEATGPDTPRVFERRSSQPLNSGVAGLYTYAGYRQFFIPQSRQLLERLAAEEGWVLERARNAPLAADERLRLTEQVCRLYLEDYARQWQMLLADIRLRQFSDPSEAAGLLEVLSEAGSPLRKLVEAVDRETALERSPAAAAKPGETATAEPAYCRLGDNRFAAFGREVQGQDGAIPPLDKTLATLNELYGQMYAIVRAGQGGEVPQDLKGKLDEVAGRLALEAVRKPPPLNDWLEQLARDSREVIRGFRERLNALWRGEKVLPFYRERLSRRYPLVRIVIQRTGQGPVRAMPQNSIQWVGQGSIAAMTDLPETSLEDFGRFFGPSGLINGFFQKHLEPYLDTRSGQSWSWRASVAPEQRISPEALTAFQQAAAVGQILFQGDGALPKVRFELVPIALDPTASRFELELGGQRIGYQAGGPSAASTLQWPGPNGSGQARIEFFPAPVGGRSILAEDGPWGWFKLLDQSQVRYLQPGRFEVTFQAGGRKASYEMRTQSATNPFRLQMLEKFNCPETL